MSNTSISTERLWELLSDRLRSFLTRRVADPQIAEDLLQETFARIHQGLGSLADEQGIEPWVFQIARNLVIDFQRSRKSDAVGEADRDEPASKDATDAGNLNEVVQGWLPAMLDQLPEQYGEALRLYEFEGLSQQAIADRLGISLSGAKSRIQRGREKLKALLFDCCSFERDRRGNVIGFTRNGAQGCAPCAEDR